MHALPAAPPPRSCAAGRASRGRGCTSRSRRQPRPEGSSTCTWSRSLSNALLTGALPGSQGGRAHCESATAVVIAACIASHSRTIAAPTRSAPRPRPTTTHAHPAAASATPPFVEVAELSHTLAHLTLLPPVHRVAPVVCRSTPPTSIPSPRPRGSENGKTAKRCRESAGASDVRRALGRRHAAGAASPHGSL